jgi:phage terminase small subunit
MTLTHREERFVAEYILDLNAAAAARRAGYARISAAHNGCRILDRPHVAHAVQTALAERAERMTVTADNVLRGFARLAFFDPRKLYHQDGSLKAVHELDEDTAAAVEIIAVPSPDGIAPPQTRLRFSASTRRKALVELARHLGISKPRGEASNGEILHDGRALRPMDEDDFAAGARMAAILGEVRRREAEQAAERQAAEAGFGEPENFG